MDIIIAAIIIAIAIVGVFLLSSRRKKQDEETAKMMNDFAEKQKELLAMARSQHETQLQEQARHYERQNEQLTARLEQQQSEARRSAANEFNALAGEIMQRASERLREDNSHQLGELLTPLKTRIEDFQKAFDRNAQQEVATTAALEKHISLLAQTNQRMCDETQRLTHALRNDSQAQGAYGEQTLRALLEQYGLIDKVTYDAQLTNQEGLKIRNEQNQGLRPDFVVKIGEGRNLVIDSKMSLNAYVDYSNAETEAQRQEAGKKLVASVRNHIKELIRADYQKHVAGSADFVLMFIPTEGAYYAAVRIEPELARFAYDNKIALTGPTHLLTLLPLISQIWRREEQNRNAQRISEGAGALYDQAVAFIQDFDKVGAALLSTQKAFDAATHRLSGTNRSLVAKAERIRDLGAKTSKRINEKYLPDTDSSTSDAEPGNSDQD